MMVRFFKKNKRKTATYQKPLLLGERPNIPIFSSKEAAKSELRALESDLNIADDLVVDTQEKLLEGSQIIQSTDTGLHPDCGDSVPIVEKVPSAGKFKDGVLAQSNEPPSQRMMWGMMGVIPRTVQSCQWRVRR